MLLNRLLAQFDHSRFKEEAARSIHGHDRLGRGPNSNK
jgi:hypothetical protein